ncbi:39S ribosomal protein L53, mitochondrial-like [Limulus polyphemus]|uniref:Large ribosomal subunit protein mL53 n=1 Tax=Limulus polyphemus TaxID=6850 RepID=A0ABM1BQ89_LIMPO|nr:39S ribosomal protein L53, mitochondrial-like [Limulus polyphemus]
MAAVNSVKSPVKMALYRTVKELHLRPVQQVKIKFDPFHPNVESVRDLLFFLSIQRVRESNTKCSLKTEVANDRSEPQVDVKLASGKNSRLDSVT